MRLHLTCLNLTSLFMPKLLNILRRWTVYYLLGSGIAINLLLVAAYSYDSEAFAVAYDRLLLAIRQTTEPNALLAEQARWRQRLDSDIAANVAPWQALPETTPPIAANRIKIGDKLYFTLAAASADLEDQQTLLIGPGVYREALVLNQNHIHVIGSGRVVLDGISAEGKAAILTKGLDISISNIECKNIAVPDQNGACLRSEGLGLQLNHVYFHDAEQGILSDNKPQQTIHITDSRFEKLGKDGRAHGLYIGGGELLIEDSLMLAAVSQGHEIKSRARKTTIRHSIIASLAAEDSRLIDIPNGGELLIEDSVLEKGPPSANSGAIGYGLEGLSYLDNSITLKRNAIILERIGHNLLLSVVQTDKPLPIVGIGNATVSKDAVELDGLNWLYPDRAAATMADYPLLPKLGTQQGQNSGRAGQ